MSCARENLLPLARKHLFPIALNHLLPILKEAGYMIWGVPIPKVKIKELKKELESIQEFIHEADKMADAEGANPTDGTREKIKQLIEASFHIQDVIDEYIIREEQQLPDPGCAAAASDYVKTKMLRLQIAHDIQIIKSQINEMKDTSSEKEHDGSSSSATNPNATSLHNLKKAPFYMEETDVVGFEEPRDVLINWLVGGRSELTVISLVGMAGLGKTTLAKKVFDNIKIVKHFDCHVWITVSQSYDRKQLLIDMLHQIYKQQQVVPPQSIHQMDQDSLVDEVRKCLKEKRYVVVFDDVWNLKFWDDIQFAMIENKNSCKILITSRMMNVTDACRKSSFVEVHNLKALTKEQSLELFNKKAFHDLNGCCPENLIHISSKIVEKCNGLPLAIVVTGGLLSCKDRNTLEWYNFSKNLNSLLKEDSTTKKILGLSYHDLSYNLKSCLLYFGLYPEDYVVPSKILISQWIAEGFVEKIKGVTLEEVAKGYLTKLIRRSLVQVDSISVDGREKSCRVHDLVHAMILEKCEELSFCKHIFEGKQLSLTGMVRRLSIATAGSDNLVENIENSQVRSLLVLTPKTISESFVRRIPTKYRGLKVLSFEHEHVGLLDVPEDLGNLVHLKYFRLRDERPQDSCHTLPKSIGMLENLETLDLTHTKFSIMPKEICKLRKLRHFLGHNMSLIHLKDGIGGLTSLQTLRSVYLDEHEDENDNRVIELIQELGKLIMLRELGLFGVRGKYMSAISSSISEMQQMEELCIHTYGFEGEFIDMHMSTPPPMLQTLILHGNLQELPEWISTLQNLVELNLGDTRITYDLMKLLKSIPNLLSLSINGCFCAGEFEKLRFEVGCFKNLAELFLSNVHDLNSIHIDEGALSSLRRFDLFMMQDLKSLPTGIQHLQKLQFLTTVLPSFKFSRNFHHLGGNMNSSLKHVPHVHILARNYSELSLPRRKHEL